MRYTFATLLSLSLLSQDVFSRQYFNSLWILVLIFILYLINRIEETKNQQIGLDGGEKIGVITTSILFLFIATAFYYFCLKGKQTLRARQAIRYSITSMLAIFIPIVVLITINDIRKFAF